MGIGRSASVKKSFDMFKNRQRPVQIFFAPLVGAKDMAISAYTNVLKRLRSEVSVEVRPVAQTRPQNKNIAEGAARL